MVESTQSKDYLNVSKMKELQTAIQNGKLSLNYCLTLCLGRARPLQHTHPTESFHVLHQIEVSHLDRQANSCCHSKQKASQIH